MKTALFILIGIMCLVSSVFGQKVQDQFENIPTIIAPDLVYFSEEGDDSKTSWNTELGSVVSKKIRPYFGTSVEVRVGKGKGTLLGGMRNFTNFSSELWLGYHVQLNKINLGMGVFSRSLTTNDAKASRAGVALNLGYRSEKIGERHFIDIQTQTTVAAKHESGGFLKKEFVGVQTKLSARHMILIPALYGWVGYYGLLASSSSVGVTGGMKDKINDFALSYQINYNTGQHLVTLSYNWSGINSLKWFRRFSISDMDSNPRNGAKEKRKDAKFD